MDFESGGSRVHDKEFIETLRAERDFSTDLLSYSIKEIREFETERANPGHYSTPGLLRCMPNNCRVKMVGVEAEEILYET